MSKFAGALATYPARALTAWYSVLIVTGTGLLMLPACRLPAVPALSLTDALFTATSAACVTGLVVRDVAEFSFLGQGLILILIQLGGIGIITLATLVVIQVTGRQSLRQLVLARESIGMDLHEDVGRLLGRVVGACLIFEALGAFVLFMDQIPEMGVAAAAWWGVFHAVSAFCNAGFALSPENLAPWAGDSLVCWVVIILVVLGGLGFPVLVDLFEHRSRRWILRWRDLTLHSQLMITASTILLAAGTIFLFLLERNRALAHMGTGQALLTSLFHSASARTAGFSTVDIGTFGNAGLFVLIMLMWIGGGPGSAAGGVKVTTVSVLVVYGISRIRGASEAALFRHRVPEEAVSAAAVVVILGVTMIVSSLFLLLTTDQPGPPHNGGDGFMGAAFEVFSAFSTVGLSTGVTRELTDPGRWVITGTMFFGRIGPLVLVTLLTRRGRGPEVRHPEAEIHIG
jgi:trk system potassium uptake protein TrkH